MLGFALPMYVIGSAQALTAVLLLLPAPFNEPAVKLCQLSKSSNGRTAIWTLTGFMVFMLLAPLWDLYRLSQHSEGSAAGGASLERRETEATANLNAVMSGSSIVTTFILRKLGLVIHENAVLTGKAPKAA
ncbi:hypothetical protein WJX74_001982 [Apatococcus lobatus]|uniref:Endoplasmic reticulum transmembrane protein n=1 Tax=Apatococcus lobatus TaxID=904363 RepID=A0AAW1RY61_9CHLO